DGLGAGPQGRGEEIGEDVAPAVPRRRRDPPPRAVRPARRGQAGPRGQPAVFRRGDVADPVTDLGHHRLLGPVEGDDPAEAASRGGARVAPARAGVPEPIGAGRDQFTCPANPRQAGAAASATRTRRLCTSLYSQTADRPVCPGSRTVPATSPARTT